MPPRSAHSGPAHSQVMYTRLIRPDIRMMLDEDDQDGLREFCEALYPAVAAEVLDDMPPAEIWKILSTCAIGRAAEIFEFLSPERQLQLVDLMDRRQLSQIIEHMSADDRVDLLEQMDDEHVEALLPLIAQAERNEIRKLLSYPDNSAGSIMTTEYAYAPSNITVREALERLKQQAPDSETIYYMFVVDDDRHLQGVVTLRELFLARSNIRLSELMRPGLVLVHVNDDKEFAARQLALYDLLALPVVDDQDRLVGIITHDDILDVVQEEADEDAYRQSAIEPLEQGYLSTPILTIVWKRGIWLAVLAMVAFLTAAIQAAFGDISRRHDWMAWFLPLVLASGGNTGSQSATLVIRAIAVATMSRQEKSLMARRELLTGLLLGTGLALIAFTGAHLLFSLPVHQAFVVAGTVHLVVTVGTVLGSALPLIFDRLGFDPALMSNPLIASLSDILGVVIYYTVAILVLEMVLG